MPDPDYRLFSPDPDSNTSSSPVGAPEGGYKGSWVNDTLRFMMATIRRLGDSTLKVGGDTMSGDSVAGLMALKNGLVAADIALLPGVVPIGCVVPFWGTLTAAVALEPRGWQVCDGRVSTIAGTAYTAPDLRGVYQRFFSATVAPQTAGGSLTTATDGSGTTGGTAISAAQAPAAVSAVYSTGTEATEAMILERGTARGLHVDATRASGATQPHTHTISAHAHAVNPPPYAAVIPLLRVF